MPATAAEDRVAALKELARRGASARDARLVSGVEAISRPSGEMGFNLGPSLLTPAPADTAKPRHGYFFSVWKRQADGKFKVVLDIGS